MDIHYEKRAKLLGRGKMQNPNREGYSQISPEIPNRRNQNSYPLLATVGGERQIARENTKYGDYKLQQAPYQTYNN